MKILQMHVDFIEYKPVKKEIEAAEDAKPELVREEELLVLFTAFEKGDTAELAKKAVLDAKDFLARLGSNRLMIYPFAHLSQNLAKPSESMPILKAMEAEARANGMETMRSPFGWTKSLQIKVKGHPLAEMSRSYTNELASGSAAPQQRRRELSNADLRARLKKSDFGDLPESDHRVIGERLDLFSFQETSPGMVYWHDKGLKVWRALLEMIRKEEAAKGYIELSMPLLANSALWKVSGHWDFYKQNMFVTSLGGEEFALKPMNCPSTMLYYKSKKWSFRDLPLRVACFDTLHRNELSGVASGLFRVKMLTQDDAHIFATREQADEVIGELLDLMQRLYGIFKFDFEVGISTMPDEHAGTLEEWDQATEVLKRAVTSRGMKYYIKEKDGTFYAPKIDVDVKDSMGRRWQCTTIQLDYQLPRRFGLVYTGTDGKEHETITVHRAIFGSLERFIGILLEHYHGKLPVWLSPVQATVIPLSDENRGYATKVLAALLEGGVRVQGDFESGTLGSKVRRSQLEKIPYAVVVGAKEEAAKTLAIRARDGEQRFGLTTREFIDEVRTLASKFG
ncbi:MAG: threonine--tRNA ligase [Thaumarchaeota archaeon]|nr:threonine--tRNA ligase [Nitrososphaerota archaeon]